MLHKLVTVAAWICLVLITIATLVPIHLRPQLTTTEPVSVVVLERFAAFALLGFLFALAHPRRPKLVIAIVFGSAALLEFLQIFIPDRDARVLDVIEKTAGGAVGMIATRWLPAVRKSETS
jgi:glycopeptide antibiotics resistance protein